MIPIPHNLFQKIEIEEIFPKSLYEASLALLPKPNKDITRKKKCKPISLMNTDEKEINKQKYKQQKKINAKCNK